MQRIKCESFLSDALLSQKHIFTLLLCISETARHVFAKNQSAHLFVNSNRNESFKSVHLCSRNCRRKIVSKMVFILSLFFVKSHTMQYSVFIDFLHKFVFFIHIFYTLIFIFFLYLNSILLYIIWVFTYPYRSIFSNANVYHCMITWCPQRRIWTCNFVDVLLCLLPYKLQSLSRRHLVIRFFS